MNYIGEHCFSCGSEFTKHDDVVVCPDCGTPYHRGCYAEAGECINHQLHESGGSWQREITEKNTDDKNVRICPICRNKNSSDAVKCTSCGTLLNNTENENIRADAAPEFIKIDINNPTLGFNPDEDFGGASLKEVSQFVGSNTLYYIPIFKKMKDIGSKISFNMICLFFPYFYFANRKMWFWAILTALISLICNIPTMLYIIGDQSSMMPFMSGISDFIISNKDFIISLMDICNVADWILRLCMCLFGNWIYFRFTISSINKLRSRCGGQLTPQRLKAKGGVQPLNIIFICLIIIGLTLAAYFAITFILMFLQQSGVL